MRTDKWLVEVEQYAKNAGHFRVLDLLEMMRHAGVPISRATVYRAVNKLLAAGRIIQISSEKERYFEFMHPQVHYHFKCKRCGKIIEFFFDDIDRIIQEYAKKLNIILSEQKLILEGICDHCNKGKNVRKKRNIEKSKRK